MRLEDMELLHDVTIELARVISDCVGARSMASRTKGVNLRKGRAHVEEGTALDSSELRAIADDLDRVERVRTALPLGEEMRALVKAFEERTGADEALRVRFRRPEAGAVARHLLAALGEGDGTRPVEEPPSEEDAPPPVLEPPPETIRRSEQCRHCGETLGRDGKCVYSCCPGKEDQ